ncbi:MAG: glycosyltransferase family 2 protein [Verrucomicrobiota bacterium]
MAVSVIVSNFNGISFLPRLIESLRAQQGVELEIIIVDRKSTDGSLDFLRDVSEIQLITEPPETGLVAGYHAGSKIATRENLFFCNEDMWFSSDCLSKLEKAIDIDKKIIAADPWQWTYQGDERIHAGTRFQKCRFSFNSPHPFYQADFDCELKEGEGVPFPCAGAVMISAIHYRKLGGWDSSFFLNHEDTDLFLRAWQQGYSCVSVPSAKVYHACGASNQKTIAGGKLSVGKRRYISNFSSLIIMGIKYFSGFFVLLGLLSTFVRMASNVIRFRFVYLGWDFLVLREVMKRFRGACEYRKTHREWNRLKPGESFFTDSSFSK